MKKIVYVVESFSAGVYTFLNDLSNSIVDNYQVVIIYSLRKETPKNFRDSFNLKIKFIHIDMCRGFDIFKNMKSLIKLKRVLRKEKPDIVHLNSSKAGFLGRIACFSNRFNMDNVFYNPHGFSFLQNNEPIWKRKIYFFLESFAAKLGGKIIGCSKGEYEECLKISPKCININNGIDTKIIDEIINGLKIKSNGKLKIGTVGRICNQKNPKLFNDIAKYFNDYDFIWIGDGDLRGNLEEKNIEITGWLDRKEVIKELINVDIFILTSLWEGLPLSLLEAMYLGKPVIISSSITNIGVINVDINGFIAYKLSDYIKIIKHIKKNNIMQDEMFKEEVKNNIIVKYGEKQMVKKYVNLYEINKEILGDELYEV